MILFEVMLLVIGSVDLGKEKFCPPSLLSIQSGSKSKLLILCEYVNNTEKIGGT